MQEYLIAKQTVQHIFGIDWKNEEEKRQKEQEQQNRTDHVVSGFAFYSEKDARLAEQERQKIAYLDKRIDRTNLESVLVIYKKALDDRVFRTPVGLEYLRELQGELKQSRICWEKRFRLSLCGRTLRTPGKKRLLPEEESNRHRKKIKIRRSGCLLL